MPVSAFDNGSRNGFYTLQQLGLPQGSQLVLSMSDANGIFSGGTSALMIVGASQTQQACNMTDPGRCCTPHIFVTIQGCCLLPRRNRFLLFPRLAFGPMQVSIVGFTPL